MKKKLFVTLCILGCYIGYGQYTSIPDSNFELALISLGIDSEGTPIDGQILTADIINITNLDISNSSINDLSGLEFFSSLEILNVNGNNLDKLELQNTSLTEIRANNCNLAGKSIRFQNNPPSGSFLVNVTTLFLENNNFGNAGSAISFGGIPNVEHLYLRGNSFGTLLLGETNQIKTLSLEENSNLTSITSLETLTELITLDITKCALNTLDVTQNTNLTNLSVGGNPLTTLNLQNNILLNSFVIEGTQITLLDLSQNSNLGVVAINNSLISNIDLSNNPNLVFVNVYSNDDLSLLNLNNNNNGIITTLYATSNPNLNCIQVDNVPDAENKANWQKDNNASYSTNCNALNKIVSFSISPEQTLDPEGNYVITAGTNEIYLNYNLEDENGNELPPSSLATYNFEFSTLEHPSKNTATGGNTTDTGIDFELITDRQVNATTTIVGEDGSEIIDISGDGIFEGDEYFLIEISSTDTNITLKNSVDGIVQLPVRIIDNEITNVSLEIVNNGIEGSQDVRLRIVSSLENHTGADMPFNITLQNGSATNGTDFELENTTIQLPNGASSIEFDISVLTDEFNLEGTEDFIATVSYAGDIDPNRIQIENATVMPTIEDADSTFKVSAYLVDAGQGPNYEVSEGSGFYIRFNAMDNNLEGQSFDVLYNISGLATEEDYIFSDNWNFTINPLNNFDESVYFNILRDSNIDEDETIIITLPKPTGNYEWENANSDGSLTFEISLENIGVIPISASINGAGALPDFSVQEGNEFTIEFNAVDTNLNNDNVRFKMETIGSPEDFSIENYFENDGFGNASFIITNTVEPDNVITFNTIADNVPDEGDIIKINLKLLENYVWDNSETESDGSLNFEVAIEDSPLLESQPFEIKLTPKIDGTEISNISSIEINEGQEFSIDFKALSPATDNYNYSVFYNISGSDAMPDDDFMLDDNPKNFNVQSTANIDGLFTFLINSDTETEEDETLIINFSPDPSNIYSWDSNNLNDDGSISFELIIKNVVPEVSDIITVEFDNSGGYEGLSDTFTITLKDSQSNPWINNTGDSIIFPVTIELFSAEESDFALFDSITLAETIIMIEINEGESEGNLVLELNTDTDSERESYEVTIDNPTSSTEFNITTETIFAEIIDSEGIFYVTAIAEPNGNLKLITGDLEFESNCCRAYTIEEGKQLSIQFKAEKGVPAGITYDFNASYSGDVTEQDFQKIDPDDVLNGTVKTGDRLFDNQFQLQFLLDDNNNEISHSGSELRDYGESFGLSFTPKNNANYSIQDPENEGFSSSYFQIFIVDVVPVTIYSEPNEQIATESPITNARFTAELDAPNSTGGDIKVNYEIILNDGDAVPGEDYTIAGLDYNTRIGTITIPFQQQFGSITVVPINDDKFEPDENVTVKLLSGESYGVKNVNNQAQITIKSEDQAEYTATIRSGDDNLSREADDTDFAEVIIELNAIPVTDIEVEFKISSFTNSLNVIEDEDYLIYLEDKQTIISSTERSITFRGNIDKTKSVFIKAIEDGLDENNESLYLQLDSGVNYNPISEEDAEVILISSTSNTTNFDPRTITVIAKNPRCPGNDQEGLIEISNASFFIFDVTINGLDNTNYSETKKLDKNDSNSFIQSFENLSIGRYEVTLSFDTDLNASIPANSTPPNYIVEITELQGLTVEDQGVNLKAKTASFIVSGSTTYEVKSKETIFQYSFNDTQRNIINVPLDSGLNTISISGETICLGIIEKEVLLNDFFIYPNPTYNSLNILSKTFNGTYKIEIFDIQGRLVFEEKNNNQSNNINLDVSKIQKGMYLCRMISESNNKIEFKFIKK
ncbi:MAG: T9SS type A sorting domain-containing protein [Maribacter litoralis]|uniref:T9SS type A sorting domain-containing protein n=1 Tax=Maribacter litoralis TaxID=2059726 RepID=UPI0032987BA8